MAKTVLWGVSVTTSDMFLQLVMENPKNHSTIVKLDLSISIRRFNGKNKKVYITNSHMEC